MWLQGSYKAHEVFKGCARWFGVCNEFVMDFCLKYFDKLKYAPRISMVEIVVNKIFSSDPNPLLPGLKENKK